MLPQMRLSLDTRREGLTKCFACGQDNPIGLKLNFRWDGETARAEFTPGEFHQGWPGIIHGGLINILLDEAMTYAAYFQGINCVTGKMQVRFRQPVPVGEPLLIAATVTKKSRKLVETRATVVLKDNELVAESTALLYVLSEGREGTGKEKGAAKLK